MDDLLHRDDVIAALSEVQRGLAPTLEMNAVYERIKELPARPIPLTSDQPHAPESLTEPPEISDYRFGRLVKGETYAYARGLLVAPTHLPKALDAMEKDGWSLVGIFGETDAENVGFIFRKSPPHMQMFGRAKRPDNFDGRNKFEPRLTGDEIFAALKQGEKSFDHATPSPYSGGSIEHQIHAYGWVKRDLQIGLCKAKPSYGEEQIRFGTVKKEQIG